jgi:hypothetical protein
MIIQRLSASSFKFRSSQGRVIMIDPWLTNDPLWPTAMTPDGKIEMVGAAAGDVIEFEDGQKVYVSGDTGLTADMKFVVGAYHKPYISILPAIGRLVMEPEQAAYAASVTGCGHAIPCHDFPRNVSDAANPEAYSEFLKQFPVLDTYKKVDKFMEIIARDYPQIEGVYIPIGGSVYIK